MKRTSNRRTGAPLIGFVACLLAALAHSGGAQAQVLPANDLITAPLVSPSAAWAYYSTSLTHTTGIAALSATAPDVAALARALGADKVIASQMTAAQYAQNVFDYVRNNIEVEFRFGLGKGGRGALIDQSGTPFDQAQLMVTLLRAANITANYQVGTITLTPNQFGLWTGLVNGLNTANQTFSVDAHSACQFLADGGIPATVGSASACSSVTGSLSSVTLEHIWVSALGNLYDPSFKTHVLAAGIDIPSAMGCGTEAAPTCGAVMTSQAGGTSGTSGAYPSFTKFNTTNLESWLTGAATNVQNAILTQNRLAYIQDIVGGKRLVNTTVTAGASLPYTVASVLWTSSSSTPNIPDTLRTTLRIRFQSGSLLGSSGADVTFFADELAGRVLQLAATDNVVLDGAAVTGTASCGSCTASTVLLDINHPYAASSGTYGDDHTQIGLTNGGGDGYTLPTRGVFPATVVLQLGSAGPGTEQHTAELMGMLSPVYWEDSWNLSDTSGLANTIVVDSTYESSDQPLIGARLVSQGAVVDQLVAGLAAAAITPHHAFGIVYAHPFNPSTMSLMSVQEAVSVNLNATSSNPTNDSNSRRAAFEAEAATWAMLEGTDDQQLNNTDTGFSTASWFRTVNDNSQTMSGYGFIQISAAQLAASGIPNTKLIGQAGYSEITTIPQDGAELFSNATSSANTIYGGTLKGDAAVPTNPVSTALNTVRLTNTSEAHRRAVVVSPADGTATITQTDLVDGAGDFPEALPFTRTYRSGALTTQVLTTSSTTSQDTQNNGSSTSSTSYAIRYTGPDSASNSPLGGGWDHNYDVTASYTSNGAKAFGYDTAVEASAAIAAVYSFMDASRSPTFASRVVSELTEFWLAKQVVYNSVVVNKGGETESFQRLPDGSFFTATGKARLVQHGQEGLARDFSPVSFTYTGQYGDTISFDVARYTQYPYPSTSNAQKIGDPVFKADTWSFPDGTVLTFSYTGQYLVSGWPEPIPIECTVPGSCSAPPVPNAEPYGFVLQSVSNNLGHSLTFHTTSSQAPITAPGGTSYNQTAVQFQLVSVTDENNRKVTLGDSSCPSLSYLNGSSGTIQSVSLQGALYACATMSAAEPDGGGYEYTYGQNPATLNPATMQANAYRLQKLYTPAFSLAGSPTKPYRTLAYDGLAHVTSVTDRLSRVTTYRAGGVTGFENWKRGEVDMPAGDVWTSTYDLRNSMLSSTDPLGNKTAMTYDNAERVLTTINPELDSIAYTYDVRSNVLSTTYHAKPSSGLADIVTSTTYEEGPTVYPCAYPASCNRPYLQTDGNGVTQRNTWSASSGLLTKIEPALTGSTTSLTCALTGGVCPETDITYTTYGSLILPTTRTDKVSSSQNLITTYTYNSANHYVLQTATVDSGSGELNLTTTLVYDGVGNLTQVTYPRTDVSDVRNFTWDNMRRLTMAVEADPDGGGPLPRTATRYDYDSAKEGLLVGMDLGTYTSAFTPSLSTTYVYDNEDNKAIEMRPNKEEVLQYSYDADNRPLCTAIRMNPSTFSSLPPSACTLAPAGTYGSDRTTQFIYDAAGHLTTEQRAYGTSLQENYATYQYTPNGKVNWQEDANGNRTQNIYDGHNRLEMMYFPSPATPHQYNSSDYEKYGYDKNNNLTSKQLRTGETIGYQYDAMNRLQEKVIPSGHTNEPSVFYGYDLVGDPLYANYGSVTGSGVSYTYDTALRLHTETTFGKALTYGHDGNGNRTSVMYPDGNIIDYTFDAANHMSHVEQRTTSGDTVLATYAYDSLGRRLTLTRADNINTTYGYQSNTDLLGSLMFSGGSQSVYQTFTYNPAMQVLSRTWGNEAYGYYPASSSSATYVPNGLNRYSSVGGTSYAYDGRGNLTNDGSRSFTFDLENRLLSVDGSLMTLSYDPLGRLSQVVAGGSTTNFLYDGDRLTEEYNGSGTALRRYVHGADDDEPLVWYQGADLSTPNWLIADQQGSIVAQATSGGTATVYTYDPYGQVGGNWTGSRFRYTGQIALNDASGVNLYYYKARVYDPGQGRFLQTDPVGYRDDLDLYSYVHDDPLDATDPSGQYLCSDSPNSGNCTAVANALAHAREVEAHMSGKDKERLAAVLAFYGKPGEKNGVNVNFSPDVDMGQTVMNKDGTITITFMSQFSKMGTGWAPAKNADVQASAVAHEGSHGIDDRAVGHGPRNHDEAMATERTAYELQSEMHEAFGTKDISGTWDPAWSRSQVKDLRAKGIENAALNSASAWCAAVPEQCVQ